MSRFGLLIHKYAVGLIDNVDSGLDVIKYLFLLFFGSFLFSLKVDMDPVSDSLGLVALAVDHHFVMKLRSLVLAL